MPDLPSTVEITRLARSPSALLDHLSTMGSDSDTEAAPLRRAAVELVPDPTETPMPIAVMHPAPPSASTAPPGTRRLQPALPSDPGLN